MDWTKINAIHDVLMAEVRKQDGAAWKASASEMQSQYNELSFWILLYEDAQLAEVHGIFQGIVSQYFDAIKPVNLTVAYLMVVKGEKIQTDYMEGESEIMRDQHLMGHRPTSMGSGDFVVFKGMDSTRP